MRLSRIRIKNFRSLADIDLEIDSGTVIVGENRSGKSSLMHALRLVLDGSLSHADRQLQKEDFWDGLSDGTAGWDPMKAGEEITVSVDICDFGDSPRAVAALGHALLPDDEMKARLTYRYAPDPGKGKRTRPVYLAKIFGGDDPANTISSDLRSYVHLAFLHALRDVEQDIASWRRSPLRKLLESAAEEVPESSLSTAKSAIDDANKKLSNLKQIKDLGSSIESETEELVGDRQALKAKLAIASPDPLRLLRSMRLFVDGEANRPLYTSSLGTLNVLYFALLQLGLKKEREQDAFVHVLFCVEEPEAHLHPHLQRLVFGQLLRSEEEGESVVVTTQSPHIASVAAPQSLVVLREKDGRTAANTARSAQLDQREWADIDRYLDATRAEIVFARRVLLVEGYAEQVLAPVLAKAKGIDLDKEGITICSVHGTHFTSYVRFCEALGIPWAVVTDGDLNAAGERSGDRRAAALVSALGKSGTPANAGIFVGSDTFELDLFRSSEKSRSAMVEVLKELAPKKADEVDAWRNTEPELTTLINLIKDTGGKGRFAQRLATHTVEPPAAFAAALAHLVAQ